MKPEYIDIHAHINFKDYDNDREDIINKTIKENVWFMNIGTDIETSKEVIKLGDGYNGVYSCIGIHPTHTKNTNNSDILELEKLISNKKVKAVGECGLDYFRMNEDSKNNQIELFEKQIELSIKYKKPLMLHIRNAYEDAISVLKKYPHAKGNVHFFAGSYDIAKQFLDLGFTLSFTGVITFADTYNEVIKNIPLENIMSETDCPYVSPTPYRGKRNEPLYVKEVIKKIANIRNEGVETVKTTLVDNAIKVFDF